MVEVQCCTGQRCMLSGAWILDEVDQVVLIFQSKVVVG